VTDGEWASDRQSTNPDRQVPGDSQGRREEANLNFSSLPPEPTHGGGRGLVEAIVTIRQTGRYALSSSLPSGGPSLN